MATRQWQRDIVLDSTGRSYIYAPFTGPLWVLNQGPGVLTVGRIGKGNVICAINAAISFDVVKGEEIGFTGTSGTTINLFDKYDAKLVPTSKDILGTFQLADSTGTLIGPANPLQTDLIKPAGRTPLFASISVGASGANSIVAADPSNKIKVMGGWLVSSGTVNAKWQSGANDLTGLAYLVANTGYVLPIAAQFHYFETTTNAALNLNLSAAVTVGGSITYLKEPT